MTPRELIEQTRFAQRVDRCTFDELLLAPEDVARLYDARLQRLLLLRSCGGIGLDARLLDRSIVASYQVMRWIGAERVAARTLRAWREATEPQRHRGAEGGDRA